MKKTGKKRKKTNRQKQVVVAVTYRRGVFDATGEIVKHDIVDLGIQGVQSVKVSSLYSIEGTLGGDRLKSLCRALLADPVTQEFRISGGGQKGRCIRVWFKPGVTDAVGESVMEACAAMGVSGVDRVRTGKEYVLTGKLSADDRKRICERLLANTVIQTYTF